VALNATFAGDRRIALLISETPAQGLQFRRVLSLQSAQVLYTNTSLALCPDQDNPLPCTLIRSTAL
jgi:hypothetical protein